MKKTKISWTEQTANPIRARNKQNGKRGWHCVKVSDGCKNCYAERINGGPYGNGLPFREDVRADVELYLEESVLEKLERQRTRKKTFLCDMTDIFQEHVPLEWIARIWATMALCQNHTFQILTKRADRMRGVLSDKMFQVIVDGIMSERAAKNGWCITEMETYPLPNVWLGVSAEHQKAADERIPLLLQTPAAVRFLSCEPLLGEIRLDKFCGQIHWVICGGESGPHYREMNLDWARAIRNVCVQTDIPYFFKQSSGYRSETGTTLDGVEWHQFPKVK
jgi:protein gp37